MSKIIPFLFKDHDKNHEVRAVIIDSEEHFVGKDVCDALGYADHTNAMKQHCRGVVKRHPILDNLSRTQEARVLTEADVLRLIVSSKLPAAEKFERWVFEEVLPSIRKTGSYGAPDPIAVLNDPAAMRGLLLTYSEKVMALESAVAEQAPKVDVYDRISDASGSLCLRDAAKSLQIQPGKLNAWLQANGWIYRRVGKGSWTAYQEKIQSGYLTHKITPYIDSTDGENRVNEQVRVTLKGMTRIAQIIDIAKPVGLRVDRSIGGDRVFQPQI